MTEHVNHIMKMDGNVSQTEVIMDFDLEHGAQAFWIWWDSGGDKIFTQWCINGDYEHVVTHD